MSKPTLSISGCDQTAPAHRGTLLDAAIKAGLPISYDCRSGECGTCKCKLVSGEVRQLPHLPGALTQGEKADGWILSCRSHAKSDVILALPTSIADTGDGDPRIQDYPLPEAKLVVAYAQQSTLRTTDTVEFSIRMVEPLTFHPG